MNDTVTTLNRVNSVLTMLSQVNRAIVRAESPDSLYQDACRIAVECGLFKFAWIGLNDSMNKKIRSLASWGAAGKRTIQTVDLGDLADQVRRSGEPYVCKDISALHVNHPGRAAMLEYGFLSVAVLPLRERSRVIGVFSLYADNSHYFDQTIVNLLAEVADDISFSLDHMLNEQQRLAAETKLHYLSFYDSQTGLPNRILLEERFPLLAERADKSKGLLTLFDIKLHRLEHVVQILGNRAIDDVLRTFAQRLENCRGTDWLVAQLGFDEFAIVALELDDSDAISRFAQKLQVILNEPVHVDGKEVFLHAGIGVAVYPLHEREMRYLLRRARAAAETIGVEGGFKLYTADLDRDLEQRVQLEADLHRALERGEFEVYYQPQLNLKTGTVVGVEALLRWNHPRRGIIMPVEFIPLLEGIGLMSGVGTWVLRAACMQAKAWQQLGLEPIRMAVNLSAQQFRLFDLVATVKSALEDADLEPEYLDLELTESLILENVEQTIQTMHALKQLGVMLSLDDFGTGYSSLSYLRRYPVDRIKIDQSFVRDMTEHVGSAALVRSILAMANNLGLKTIAEGVETTGQFGYLRKQLCQEMQGFLFSRPIPVVELTQLLREGSKLQAENGISEAGYTLLVVDDEPNVLAALKRAFRRENWQILTASNAVEGFEMLATHEVGVILTDQRMPGITGTEFLHRVKEMYPDTIRMLLTGYADFTTVIDAVNKGDLYKVLSKPIEDDSLRENIREAFRRYEVFAENQRLTRRLAIFEQQESQHASIVTESPDPG